MNNYSSPLSIRIINKADTIIGSIVLCAFIYNFAFIGENFEPYSKQAIILELMLMVYLLICVLKILNYIVCIFQCYRVSKMGLAIYCIWTVLMFVITMFMLAVSIKSIYG